MRHATRPADNATPFAFAERLDARDPSFRENPHETLDALRESEPVYRDTVFDRVVLTNAADIAAVLSDRSLSSDPFKARPTAFGRWREEDRGQVTMFTLDDPDHARLRGLVTKAFTPSAIAGLRARIEAIAGELLDAIEPGRPFDLIASYAAPLPTLVISAMLGVDQTMVGQFMQWSKEIELLFTPDRSEDEQRRLTSAFGGLNAYLASEIAERRTRPRDDLISALVAAETDGDTLSEREIINNCRLLLVAGNITTTDLIGNGAVALLRHPEQLAQLRADPNLWPAAIEEMLRYDPPVAHHNRYVPEARRIGGCPIEVGQTITMMLLAANHDPALHENPHRFDIGRKQQKHHSFGGGAHFCLGASLARLEAEIALTALFDRFPSLRVAGDLRRKAMPTFNGYEAIRLSDDSLAIA